MSGLNFYTPVILVELMVCLGSLLQRKPASDCQVVFPYAVGGLKGTVIGSFLHGLLKTFLAVLTMPVMGDFGFSNTTIILLNLRKIKVNN